MKTILLFRHAKSDWTAETPDHERPLAPRGKKAAVKMGRMLTAAGCEPERALVSSAVRTRQTLELAAEAGGWAGPARVTDALYEASPQAVLAEIQAEDDAAAIVVVVGHEPTTSRLASLLVGGGAFDVKTATVLRIDVPVVRWADVSAGRGHLSWMLSPGTVEVGAYRRLKKKAERKAEKAAEKAAKAAARTAMSAATQTPLDGHLEVADPAAGGAPPERPASVPGAAEAAAPRA